MLFHPEHFATFGYWILSYSDVVHPFMIIFGVKTNSISLNTPRLLAMTLLVEIGEILTFVVAL